VTTAFEISSIRRNSESK